MKTLADFVSLATFDYSFNQGRREGGRGGAPAPPEHQNFLLLMAVYCIEMHYLSLYTKAKKLFYLLGTPYCYMIQNSAALTRTLRLL